MTLLTQEHLKWLLTYDSETGIWLWNHPPGYKLRQGDMAGTLRADGYRRIAIEHRRYYSAQLAFLYMTGEWPKEQVDHINRVRDDDRWVNLREASWGQNMANQGIQRNNTSGYRGVSWSFNQAKWDARFGGKRIGLFEDIEEAAQAYDTYARQKHGEYAFTNFSMEKNLDN